MSKHTSASDRHEKTKRRSLLGAFYSNNRSKHDPSAPMSDKEYKRFRGFIKAFSVLNRLVYSISGGRLMGAAAGLPLMLISYTGAKSGKTRTVPVIHIPYKEGVMAVGSLGGAPKSPLWVNSLLANPSIQVQVRSNKMKLRARLAEEPERTEVGPICLKYLPELNNYQRRTERQIPIFVCEPE